MKKLIVNKKYNEKKLNKFLLDNVPGLTFGIFSNLLRKKDIKINENIDYYKYYKDKFCKNDISDNLKERLVELRKARSTEMKLPAYYVFTNDELDKLVKLRPKTIDELKKLNILTPVKVKTHGESIINEINKN